jgi:uncharacterized damage-inducible protein DinB
MPCDTPLRAFYEGWADEHRRALDTIRPLSAEQMQLRPAPGEYAVWQLASNMAGGRLYWLCFMLGEDDLGHGEMFRAGGWEDDRDHPRTAEELVDALLKTWEVVQRCMDRWTAEDLVREVTARDFWGRMQTITPAGVVWKLITHEAHHGAEISAILRVNGLPTQLNW